MAETRIILEQKLRSVLDAMARNGFEITQPIELRVDENLPFMGYTTRQSENHVIVVSGSAAQSPMLEGLLTHELSHVYRNITNHPSHNEKIIQSAAVSFTQLHGLNQGYQHQVLHQAINHIQDLYADDISFRVLTSNQDQAPTLEVLGEFFLGWIKEKPVKSSSSRKASWLNAGILLNNCFAVSNIQRRKIESYYRKAETLNENFLMRTNPNAQRAFTYFNQFMVNLTEEVTEEQFRNQLKDYLDHFWETVESL